MDISSRTVEVGRSARMAALRLSGISDTDRRWILGRLTAGQRQSVVEAYRQLKLIQGDARLDFDLFTESGNSSAISSPGGEYSPVNQMAFAEVRSILDELPIDYVAVILRSGRWQESQLYLKTCQKKRRQAIAAVTGLPVSDVVAEAMLNSVARLAQAQSE